MYLLKTELRSSDGQRVIAALPCPETELIDWLAASQQQVVGKKLERLIRSSPTLFLIAVSRAADCSGAPIQSMDQLLSRLEHCFSQSSPIDTALGHVVDTQKISVDDFKWNLEAKAAFVRFRKAKARKPLAKSLCKLIRICNKKACPKQERPSKQDVERVIDSMFADSFQVSRTKQTSSNWPTTCRTANNNVRESAMFGLLSDRQAIKKDWDQKLLDSKLVAMKQLAYGASHEINNPLANVATRAHTMLAKETDPDRRFQLAVMHEQAMRAHDMISDMMLFAHPPALQPKSVDVRLMICSLIRECENNLLPLKRCGASLSATIAKGIERATFDSTQIKVALASLIQNAAEAIRHDGGEIEIHLSKDDDSLLFSISDNGIGIDETVKQHLFDPFFSGREAGRGLGFGLSKSWRIAKLHGGSLTHHLDSVKLRTVFELRLPL